jgi:hypothetical protein
VQCFLWSASQHPPLFPHHTHRETKLDFLSPCHFFFLALSKDVTDMFLNMSLGMQRTLYVASNSLSLTSNLGAYHSASTQYIFKYLLNK